MNNIKFDKTVKPIGYVQSDFKEKFGIPRQSGRAPSAISKIIFYPEYSAQSAFSGIEGFNYLWILFDFSKVENDNWSLSVRPPRLGGNKKVGVFASRSPFRPNHIGLSSVRLLRVENTRENGCVLVVSGGDLLDGTPIYDVKPYLPFTDCHPDATGGYADAQKDYKLEVIFPEKLQENFNAEQLNALIESLSDDPRPSYQDDGKEYGMLYGNYNVKFKVKEKTLTVISVDKK